MPRALLNALDLIEQPPWSEPFAGYAVLVPEEGGPA
jgi:hypothetical protein